ncbi:MAG: pyruvate kinase [Planctomycetota bacterium]|nr:pyruvate kinase [Planctomycetota bacterium]
MLEKNLARTKIIATLGPSCAQPSRMKSMVQAGVDAFRFNMSHGDEETRRNWVASAKKVRRGLKRPVSLLCDLRGPRIRMGSWSGDVDLKKGQVVFLKPGKTKGKDGVLPVDYSGLLKDVRKGHRILLRDGRAELKVLRKTKSKIECKVIRGCCLSSNQGVNLPDSKVSAPALSAKDRKDLRFAVEMGMDWVALSFVRTADDIRILRRALTKLGSKMPIMAKIEHPEAVENLTDILQVVDAVMVARGDLAVEMGHEVVPTIQKRIVRKSIESAVPVVVATQMLESMMDAAQPTRAEVSDVANAVVDGVDAVMLSGETAVGDYALEACRVMHRIVDCTESELFTDSWRLRPELNPEGLPGHTITMATVNAGVYAAHQAKAKMILAFTESGRTAKLLASFRPRIPIVALTSKEKSYHQMALLWGVRPGLTPVPRSNSQRNRSAAKLLRESGYLRPKDLLVALTGSFQISGSTRIMQLMKLEDLA